MKKDFDDWLLTIIATVFYLLSGIMLLCATAFVVKQTWIALTH
jgi:hypothetical protein